MGGQGKREDKTMDEKLYKEHLEIMSEILANENATGEYRRTLIGIIEDATNKLADTAHRNYTYQQLAQQHAESEVIGRFEDTIESLVYDGIPRHRALAIVTRYITSLLDGDVEDDNG